VSSNDDNALTSNMRKNLFLEMAARPEGVTPSEVHKAAQVRGDNVSEEAYYNIGRRLAHRGLLQADDTTAVVRYHARQSSESRWLEEEDLSELIDPDYPLVALTVLNESGRQMQEVPEAVWAELRDRLTAQPARPLFHKAIKSYCGDFVDQIALIVELNQANSSEIPRLRSEAETTLLLLRNMLRYGLGISTDAVGLPLNVEAALAPRRQGNPVLVLDEGLLQEELERRVSDEPFILDAEIDERERKWLIGAVDGSTRAGVLSFLGEDGDFVTGHAPMVSINTAVGQVNRSLKSGPRSAPLFLRLPEKPEDMQRQDNRFTVMAKLLQPDLSDAEYMHSVWNAMDLIEARAALRLLSSWPAPKTAIEVPAADVVLRDGAVSPQDRDFIHYADFGTYGRIVREAIRINWEIARHCRDDGQTFAGVIKTAQLSVFAPVVNWFAAQVAAQGKGLIEAWPMQTMNLMPDQIILTHLLTANRRKGDRWNRTCVVVRPFHALTNFARSYRRGSSPSAPVMEKQRLALQAPDSLNPEELHFWMEFFRGENDPYVKMLEHVAYASFYLGAVPRLDIEKRLPRTEFLIVGSNGEDATRNWNEVRVHQTRLISAIAQNGYDVSAEHNMFENRAKLDVLPELLVRAHDTVKHWAADLLSRVQEYIGYYLARYVKTKGLRGIKVRPFTTAELKVLYSTLKKERDEQAGGSEGNAALNPPDD